MGRYTYCRDLLEDSSKSFGEKAARKIEDLLHLPSGYLDQVHGRTESVNDLVQIAVNRGISPGYVRLPILAQASAGPGRLPATDLELVEHVDVSEEWVRQTLRTNPRSLRVLTARGHSMRGVVEDGDVLFVQPAERFTDDGVYVIAVGDLLRVKRLRLLVLEARLSIESTDGSPPELIPQAEAEQVLHVCGRVVGAWSLKRL